MPRMVAPPTVSTMNDRVRPSRPQISVDFQMSMKFSNPTYCGGPGRGQLVAIEADAEQPQQRHDVPDDEEDEDRPEQDRGKEPALVQRARHRQPPPRLLVRGGRRR